MRNTKNSIHIKKKIIKHVETLIFDIFVVPSKTNEIRTGLRDNVI